MSSQEVSAVNQVQEDSSLTPVIPDNIVAPANDTNQVAIATGPIRSIYEYSYTERHSVYFTDEVYNIISLNLDKGIGADSINDLTIDDTIKIKGLLGPWSLRTGFSVNAIMSNGFQPRIFLLEPNEVPENIQVAWIVKADDLITLAVRDQQTGELIAEIPLIEANPSYQDAHDPPPNSREPFNPNVPIPNADTEEEPIEIEDDAGLINLKEFKFNEEDLQLVHMKKTNLEENKPNMARLFLNKFSSERNYIFIHRTGTILDSIIKFIGQKINELCETSGGQLHFYEINPVRNDEQVSIKLQGDDRAFCKDVWLLVRDPQPTNAKLGAHSQFQNLLTDVYKPRNLNFFINNKKDYNYQPVKSWSDRQDWIVPQSNPSYCNNMRVFLALFNKLYFELGFHMNTFYAIQASNKKIKPEEIGTQYQFRCHNLAILRKCINADEASALSDWFSSEEAGELEDLTKKVFSQHQYFRLGELLEASNKWDHLVPKSIIKTLYVRNKSRSQLQARKRSEIQQKSKKSKKDSTIVVPTVEYTEVFASMITDSAVRAYTNPCIIVAGLRHPNLSLEQWVTIISQCFECDLEFKIWKLRSGASLKGTDLINPVLKFNIELLRTANIKLSDAQSRDIDALIAFRQRADSVLPTGPAAAVPVNQPAPSTGASVQNAPTRGGRSGRGRN
jgi:hypothetical protein